MNQVTVRGYRMRAGDPPGPPLVKWTCAGRGQEHHPTLPLQRTRSAAASRLLDGGAVIIGLPRSPPRPAMSHEPQHGSCYDGGDGGPPQENAIEFAPDEEVEREVGDKEPEGNLGVRCHFLAGTSRVDSAQSVSRVPPPGSAMT